jgi:hypothetical protein
MAHTAKWKLIEFSIYDVACSVVAVARVAVSGSASSLPDGDDSPIRSDVDNEMSPISNAASSRDGSALTLRDDDKPVRVADRAGDIR